MATLTAVGLGTVLYDPGFHRAPVVGQALWYVLRVRSAKPTWSLTSRDLMSIREDRH